MKYLRTGFLLVAAVLFLLPGPARVPAVESPAEQATFLNIDDFKWGPPPAGLPPGAKLAVLHGNPHNPGPFVVRLALPAGYKLMPHWHTRAENLSILSGTLHLGVGDTLDHAKAHALKPGGYHYLPATMHHFAFTQAPTVLQIHGEGPFDINYVNPADDPRSQKR